MPTPQALPDLPSTPLSDEIHRRRDWFHALMRYARPAITQRALLTPDDGPAITLAEIAQRLTNLLGPAEVPDDETALVLLSKYGFSPTTTVAVLTVLAALQTRDPAYPWEALSCRSIDITSEDFNWPWRLREAARLASGFYKPAPWAGRLAPIDDHFLHRSLSHETLLAYTETAEKGDADIQTPIRPGRYLARFYPHLKPHEVRDLVASMERVVPLHFATTADDIEDIYRDGPSSCMAHPAGHFEGHCHPVRVYGDSDLALAYLRHPEDEDRITARCLVWPDKKRFGRVYGDAALLTQQLDRAGYTAGEFAGARLRHIVNRHDADSLIMPYLDGENSFDILDDDWLVIGGAHCATTTTGIVYLEETETCEHCDESVPGHRLERVDGESWCPSCIENDSFVSDYSGDRFEDREATDVAVARRADGRIITEQWTATEAEHHGFWCDLTETFWADAADFKPVTLSDGRSCVDWYLDAHPELAPDHQPDKPSFPNTPTTDAGPAPEAHAA